MKTFERSGMYVRELDDGDMRPMVPDGAPPVCTAQWSEEDFERWRQRVIEDQRAFDAWHERHPWISIFDKAKVMP
jgi:hypothetical protein